MSEPRVPHPDHKQSLHFERSEATRVTITGMALDGFLGGLKVIAGTLFHSQALVVDGIHSFSDVISDLVVIGVMRVSRQAPDQNHPYGHQRIETLGTMILGSFLIAVGAALAWDNSLRLFQGSATYVPEWPVLVAAVISVVSKEWIFRYTRYIGTTIRSELIVANAWHSRTDAFSSLVVLASTLGAMMGYLWLDVVAAVFISFIIIHVGWKFTWESVQELVDTGLSSDDTAALTDLAMGVDGVRQIHALRSRKMGQDIFLEVHLVVRPEISVSEGHQIGMHVVSAMRNAMDNILDISFHVDAENDKGQVLTSENLPGRAAIREVLQKHTSVELPADSRLRLHYLKNQIHIELFLANDGQHDPPDAGAISEQMKSYPWFGSLSIWFSAPASSKPG